MTPEIIKLNFKEIVITEEEKINDGTKIIKYVSEFNEKGKLNISRDGALDGYFSAVFEDDIIGKTLYLIYDDINLLGIASPSKHVLLFSSTVNYESKEDSLTLNQAYLHNRYKMPEYAFIILVQNNIKSNKHLERKR